MSPKSVAFPTLAALLLPLGLAAQSGTVTYERSMTRTRPAALGDLPAGARPGMRGDAAVARPPGGRMPPGGVGARRDGGTGPLQEYATLTLSFDGTSALTRIEPMAAGPGPDGGPGGGAGAAGGGLRPGGVVGGERRQAALRTRGLPGLPTRRVTAVWVDGASGEKVEVVDFMTREFRVVGPVEPLEWRLLGEESEYLGYVVQKAVAEREGSSIEAWFTVDVPGFAAPPGFGGLPGVVLMVSVDRGETLVQAVDVRVDGPTDPVVRPTGGEEITAERFEMLVAEKTEEFRTEMQSRRRAGGGGA